MDNSNWNRNGGSYLPEGSSYFQEVMAELHPTASSPPRSPDRARRHSHARSKHVRHRISHFRPKTGSTLVEEEDKDEDGKEEEEEEDRGKEVKKDVKEGPERLILHGKCHCYFVENGNVTGLADHHCHHQHRSSTSTSTNSHHTPSSSPHLPRKRTPTISPSSSPRVSRTGTPSVSPSRSPYGHRKATLTPSPEESPKVKPKFHSHRQHISYLPQHVQLEEFRGRSHSDTAVMSHLSSFKKASRTSSLLGTGHSKQSPTNTPPPTSSASDGGRTTPGQSPTSSLRQIPNDGDDLADKTSTSLRISSSRHRSSTSLEFPYEGEGSLGCKLSPR
ncbi:hypothetical protein ACOMHN_022933 [Nucella lapillus]